MAMQINKVVRSAIQGIGNCRQYSSGFIKVTGSSDLNQKSNIHVSSHREYPQAATLPLPVNIDPTESTRFSPQRSRDICGSAIAALSNQIDITTDNSIITDPHVASYDCSGAVSLNAVMQSNVPNPFGGMNKFTHLNMPGGQWEQGSKFTAQDLQSSHYTNLRQEIRSDWSGYSGASTTSRGSFFNRNTFLINCYAFSNTINTKRNFSLNSCNFQKSNEKIIEEKNKEKTTEIPITRKEKLKKAVKEYGSTVIVFHVGISLVSLGTFYLLVSSGLDVVKLLEYFGWGDSALSNKIATGASTFVIAYAIHKVFAPVRISITLGATPFIVRYLRNKGILKPPKPPTV